MYQWTDFKPAASEKNTRSSAVLMLVHAHSTLALSAARLSVLGPSLLAALKRSRGWVQGREEESSYIDGGRCIFHERTVALLIPHGYKAAVD